MRIGARLVPGSPVSAKNVVDYVHRIAEDGLSCFWSSGHLGDLEPMTASVVAGLADDRIDVGTAVVPIYQQHPFAVAWNALTVQSAVGNRLTLGIGPSHREEVETLLGASYDDPDRYAAEFAEVLVQLLSGEAVKADGTYHCVNGRIVIEGAEPPSVLVSAVGPEALRAAGTPADGTIAVWAGLRTIEEDLMPLVTAAADAAARPRPRFVLFMPVAITDDPPGARAWVDEHFGASRRVPRYRSIFEREGVRGPGDVAIVGDELDVAAQLQRLEDAGVTDLLAVPFGSADQVTRTLVGLGSVNRPSPV
jgi:F420-dependent oxidoreductase-like protein